VGFIDAFGSPVIILKRKCNYYIDIPEFLLCVTYKIRHEATINNINNIPNFPLSLGVGNISFVFFLALWRAGESVDIGFLLSLWNCICYLG